MKISKRDYRRMRNGLIPYAHKNRRQMKARKKIVNKFYGNPITLYGSYGFSRRTNFLRLVKGTRNTGHMFKRFQ